MSYPLVRDLALDGIPVKVTCRVLGFSPQAFYKWRAHPVSDREWSEAHLIDAARQIHTDDPTFGYRFIADELTAEHGISASENRVQRLCRSHGIFSVLARKKGRGLRSGPAVHDDLVRRVFSAERPNELWLTDITEHRSVASCASSGHARIASLNQLVLGAKQRPAATATGWDASNPISEAQPRAGRL